MPLIGFSDRRIAERIRSAAVLPVRTSPTPRDEGWTSWIFRTPATGIEAFEEATPWEDQDLPSEMCETWLLYKTDAGGVRRRPIKNVDGSPLMTQVANMAPGEIGGSKFIGATQFAGGVFLADWDPCDE